MRAGGAAIAIAALFAACGVPQYGGFDRDGGSEASAGSAGAADGAGGGSGGSSATGGSAGAGAGGSGGGAGSDAAAGCASDLDCTGSKKHCDTASGNCVTCLPGNDDCPGGTYCAATFTCRTGCKSDAECNAGLDGGTLRCDAASHKCLGCASDGDCPPGSVCNTTTTECTPGCTAQHACAAGNTPDCCAGQCTNLQFDSANCSTCGAACPQQLPGVTADQCQVGKCILTCAAYHADCNKDPSDGCEADTRVDPANCGGCGIKCGGGATCVQSTCQ